jgi:hypothetical protein
VTTTALALASLWPRELVLIEADPAGGDLAPRLGLPEEPGLVGLAASLRRDPRGAPLGGPPLDPYVQHSSGGIRLVTAPAGSGQASAAVRLLSGLAAVLHSEEDLIVDRGRLVGASPVGTPSTGSSLGDTAEIPVWVCRPRLADLAHLAAVVERRGEGAQGSTVVLAGDGPYPAAEVAAALDVTVLGHLPADPAGAAALWAGGGRTWVHSALGRATRELAAILAELVASEPTGGSASRSGTASPGGAALRLDSEDEPSGPPATTSTERDIGTGHLGIASAGGIR